MLKRRLLLGSGGNGPTKLSPPTFSPTPGYSGSNVRITLTNPNPSGSSIIKYTTDGTEPTATNGTTYSARVNIPSPGGVLYAVCVPSTSAYTISDVAGGEYVISNKNVNPPRISPADGTYTNAITVEMVHENDPLISIYYSYGEFSDPINNGTLYNGSFSLSTSGDYFIKAICKSSGNISTATYANYTLNITSPTLPEPFRDASLIVRMYLTSDGPSQILSAEYDYTDWESQDIRVSISDGTNGSIIEYNNYTRIGTGSTWDGTYTVPSSGYYFVVVTLPNHYIPSYLFKRTSVTEIEYISPEITKIGDPIAPNTSGHSGEMTQNHGQFPQDQSGNISEYGAFARCYSLRTIDLTLITHTTYTNIPTGTGLDEIGGASFYECNHVVEVYLPGQIEYIYTQAFSYVGKVEDSLREIQLPKNLIEIGYGAFSFCTYVQDYQMEATCLETIHASAFVGNISLATITIPSTVTSIGTKAFSHMDIGQGWGYIDCCRLVEVINLSNLNLSPNTNHTSGIGKYCISYKTSGSSDLNPRIIVDGYKILVHNGTKYMVHLIPAYNSQGYITFPDSETLGSYVLNTACLCHSTWDWQDDTFTALEINGAITEIKNFAFMYNWTRIRTIYITYDVSALPTISASTFEEIGGGGSLHVWYQTTGSSAWMSNDPYYLGYKNWTYYEYGP